MKTAGIRELKQNASAVIADVLAGDIVTITDRGRPVARIVPIEGGSVEALVASGRGRAARRRITDLGPPPRRTRDERRLSEVLEEMGNGERW
jgi:prevent-host-death family protein